MSEMFAATAAAPAFADAPGLPPAAPRTPLPALAEQARRADHADLSAKLAELQAWLGDDLAAVEAALRTQTGSSLAERAGRHLLQSGGKRIRPLCTLLAGRIGGAELDGRKTAALRDLAIAVELVHNATLLHDDVVDLADERRGRPTARALHGNEVSIFAGDWVLVAALRRIVASGHAQLVDSALDTLEQMIAAEVEQAQRSRQLLGDVDGYFRIAHGKTAALFRWAMQAGATAAGLGDGAITALQTYGAQLGVAFQITDDVIDLCGDPQATGKALFADLREGKITLPVAYALQRRPAIAQELAQLRQILAAEPTCMQTCENGTSAAATALCQSLAGQIAAAGGIDAARMQAKQHCERALAALHGLPPGPEVDALRTVADALVRRRG